MYNAPDRALLRVRFLMQQQRSLDELQRLPDPKQAYIRLLRSLRARAPASKDRREVKPG